MAKKKSLFENEHRGDFHLYDDWVFRYIYSRNREENRQALMAVLNLILDRKDDPIVEIEIQNPFYVRESEEGKESVLDVKGKSRQGISVDVEMQNGNLEFYGNRTLYYGGKMVTESLAKGENYDKMKKSVVISFVTGIMFSETEKIHNVFGVFEKNEHFSLTDRLEIDFIELDKIDPDIPVEQLSPVERLAAYMRYAGDRTKEDYVQKLIEMGGDAVVMTEEIYSTLSEDEIARAFRDSRERTERDRICAIRDAEEKGREEGLEKGRVEGLAEGREEGLAEGIRIFIEDKRDDGIDRDVILSKLQTRFALSEEQAEENLRKYWK